MHAALRMRDELGRLQVAWAARGWPRIDIRCGVHTATVFVAGAHMPAHGTASQFQCGRRWTIGASSAVKKTVR